jgi:hypothetical protein
MRVQRVAARHNRRIVVSIPFGEAGAKPMADSMAP